MKLEQRTAALLRVVADYRAQRCAELLTPARAQAQALVAGALRDARRRVHTALVEERRRAAAAIAAAEAQLATETRLAAQRRDAARLASGWTELRRALQGRWDDPGSRRHWIDAHLARAQKVLLDRAGPVDGIEPWLLRGPAGWAAGEHERVAAALREQGAPAVQFVPDEQLGAGFRVQAGHNALDATLDGLLADRSAVQGRLLQLIEEH